MKQLIVSNCLHKKWLKTCLKLVLLSFVIYLVLYTVQSVHNENTKMHPKIYMWSNITLDSDTVSCRLPLNIDPYDKTVAKFIVNDSVRRVVCPRENTSFDWTYVDTTGILKINNSLRGEKLLCDYHTYTRKYGDDNRVKYLDHGVIDKLSGVSLIKSGKNESNIFVRVKCLNGDSNEVYRNNHYWFNLNASNFKRTSRSQPSVLVLVIESLSRINYLRHMNLTRHAFESLGNVFYMKGLTKLADNSFPNMVPFLTGYTVEHFGGRYDTGPFDDFPFIWKKYQNEGYVTALMEDHYDITLFNEEVIGRKGFVRSPPTDWYTYPFWRTLMTTDYSPIEDYCSFDRVPRVEIFLAQLKHFVEQCAANSLPMFAFSFYVKLTHVRFNSARIADSHYANFIIDLKHIIQHSVVVIMGDHGSRFGDEFLQTTIGIIEERMPLYGIHIPNRILKTNPHLAEYLNANSERLSTWLDLHRIFDDIVHNNYTAITDTLDQQSYSPWRQLIPKKRTCDQALIPPIYCVCDDRIKIDTRNHLATITAFSLVKHINNLLTNNCQKLFLREIIHAEKIVMHSSISSNFMPNISDRVEVTVLVNPSQAIFRSQIAFFDDNNVIVNDEITRLNRYGNQSHCVTDPLLRKLCLCHTSQV